MHSEVVMFERPPCFVFYQRNEEFYRNLALQKIVVLWETLLIYIFKYER